MNNTWTHLYDPETTKPSQEWDTVFPHIQRNSRHRSQQSKVLAFVFWEKRWYFAVDYLEKGETITAKYYIPLLNKVKQQMVTKRQGKLLKGILFLEENAALHEAVIKHQKLGDFILKF
jgi:hypothetical protein